MTKVINLIAGSGVGKSTCAAGLFYHMKLKGINCEQVQEYVKSLAWAGHKIDPLDQITIVGEQAKREKLLYNKVDYIVTDSPLVLGGIYDEFYNKDISSSQSALHFIKKSNIEHIYFVLKRNKPFDPRGRFEDEATAIKIDNFVNKKLTEWNISYNIIESEDDKRVETIMKELNL